MSNWWDESAGFFGEFYMHGDASQEGHLSERQLTLEQRTAQEVNGVEHLLKLKPNAHILDLPCGYGRHCLELAKRGYVMHGIDINSTHLKVAVEQAKYLDLDIEFTKQNMLDLKLLQKYDAIINMFYSFGFFDSDIENMRVLKSIKDALRSNGKFLMHTDVNIPRILAGTYKTAETRRLRFGDKLHIEDRYDTLTKRIEGVWRIEKDNSVVEKEYSVRVYEESEFKAMCLEAGFSSCISYGDWSGKPYHATDSEEIIFVATV